MRFLNFSELDNVAFHRMIDRAAESSLPDDLSADAHTFASDGDLRSNNWKESPNGEDYSQRITEAGRSDLLDWGDRVIRPRVRAAYADFADRYGWTYDETGAPQRAKAERRAV